MSSDHDTPEETAQIGLNGIRSIMRPFITQAIKHNRQIQYTDTINDQQIKVRIKWEKK